MTFSVNKYQKAITEYRRNWCAIDEELYDLCRRYPDHTDARGVNAKLWLIGRTYATGIERKITTLKTQGSSLTQLSGHVLSHARQIDRLFRGLDGIAEPLDPQKLKCIVNCHGEFVRILKTITRKGQTARSFASKYLHFHHPSVPIIDTYVAAMLVKLVPWHAELWVFEPSRNADDIYAWHVMRFWSLYEVARNALENSNSTAASARTVSVKSLDSYLMWVANTAP